MRRVLQSQPVSIMAGARSASSGSAEIVVDGDASAQAADNGAGVSSEELANRDAKIAELSKRTPGRSHSAQYLRQRRPGEDRNERQISGLTGRLDEAQARLAEYEIIEDDIADLSMFKEENASLKKEVEKYKALAAAPPAVFGFESLEAEAAAAAAKPAAEVMKFEKVEKIRTQSRRRCDERIRSGRRWHVALSAFGSSRGCAEPVYEFAS